MAASDWPFMVVKSRILVDGDGGDHHFILEMGMGMENGEEKYINSNSRNASFPLHCSIILQQWHQNPAFRDTPDERREFDAS